MIVHNSNWKQEIVVEVLGDCASDPHKFGVTMKWCKEAVSTFRTEERRKVSTPSNTHGVRT